MLHEHLGDNNRRDRISWCPFFQISKYLLRGLGPQTGCRGRMTHAHWRLEGSPYMSSRSSSQEDKNFLICKGGMRASKTTQKESRHVLLGPNKHARYRHQNCKPSFVHPFIHQTIGIEGKKYKKGKEGHHWWRGGKYIQCRIHHGNKVPYLAGQNGACAWTSQIWMLPALRIHICYQILTV